MEAGDNRKRLVCAVTTRPDFIRGALPVFVAADEETNRTVAMLLGRLLDAVPHELAEGTGTYVLIQHS